MLTLLRQVDLLGLASSRKLSLRRRVASTLLYSLWQRKLEELPFIRFARAAQHIAGSQRAHTTCLTLRSEGP